MRRIVIGERGYIDASDHRWALNHGAGDVPAGAVVRFYFSPDAWIDVQYEQDYRGKDCLQVRAMPNRVHSLSMVPSSGNTLRLVPGG